MNPASLNRKTIALVSNPDAGKGKAAGIEKMVRHELDEAGIRYELFQPPWPRDFEGFDSIWLLGGDGSLHYFINAYPNLSIPIALFKGGSGNDFAWKLYGNRSPEECVRVALAASPRKVDAGLCNGRLFMNGVGIGFDGQVVKSLGHRRILPGHLAYLATVIIQIFSYREKDMIINYGTGTLHQDIFMVAIANGSRYGGGFLIAPDARVDDGALDIVIIKPIGILKRLLHLPKVERGRHLQLPFVESRRSGSVRIHSNNLLPAHLDGEYMEAKEFTIDLLPARFSFLY